MFGKIIDVGFVQIGIRPRLKDDSARDGLRPFDDNGKQTGKLSIYDRLIEVVRFFGKWRILPFGKIAANTFNQLRGQQIRIGTQNFKIASICLRYDATLLSSNLRDFEQIPHLRVEDWVYG